MVEDSIGWRSIENTQQELLNEEFIPLESDVSLRHATEKMALVGRIIITETFNRITIIMLKERWNNPNKMLVVEVGSHTFVFGFQDQETPQKIMEKSPWHVLGFLACLKWWDSQMTINELDFSHSPYWIKVHGLPIDYLNMKNARQIGERMGEVLAVDNPLEGNYLIRNYITVRVNVNITTPLSNWFLGSKER